MRNFFRVLSDDDLFLMTCFSAGGRTKWIRRGIHECQGHAIRADGDNDTPCSVEWKTVELGGLVFPADEHVSTGFMNSTWVSSDRATCVFSVLDVLNTRRQRREHEEQGALD